MYHLRKNSKKDWFETIKVSFSKVDVAQLFISSVCDQ